MEHYSTYYNILSEFYVKNWYALLIDIRTTRLSSFSYSAQLSLRLLAVPMRFPSQLSQLLKADEVALFADNYVKW